MTKMNAYGMTIQAGTLYFIAGIALYAARIQPATISTEVRRPQNATATNCAAAENNCAMYIHFIQ